MGCEQHGADDTYDLVITPRQINPADKLTIKNVETKLNDDNVRILVTKVNIIQNESEDTVLSFAGRNNDAGEKLLVPVPRNFDADFEIFRGSAKDEEIIGISGDDVIFGLGGDDEIFANAGSRSFLFGGPGNDILHGGTGNGSVDHFMISLEVNSKDTIKDFDSHDKISLTFETENDSGYRTLSNAASTADALVALGVSWRHIDTNSDRSNDSTVIKWNDGTTVHDLALVEGFLIEEADFFDTYFAIDTF